MATQQQGNGVPQNGDGTYTAHNGVKSEFICAVGEKLAINPAS